MGKFNLAAAAGYEKMVSKLDTDKQEIQMIPLDKIDPNKENFFQVEDVQDLAESMEINGILQPLLLVRIGERYRILAGHRRYKAASTLTASGHDKFSKVPAVVLPEMSPAMEQLILIQTNTTARQLTYNEKMTAAERLKKTLLELRKEGVKLPGKLRDIMAEQLEVSKTELARMNVIKKGLSDAWKAELKKEIINPFCAYELARLSQEDQKVLFDGKFREDGYLCQAEVKAYVQKKACSSWIRQDCALVDGVWAHTRRAAGQPVECVSYKDILRCKEKLEKQGKEPDLCCGCCDGCGRLRDCTFACRYAVARINRERQQAEEQKRQEIEKAEQQRRAAAFAASKAHRFQEILKQNLPCWDESAMDDIVIKLNQRYGEMCGQDNVVFPVDRDDLDELLNAEDYNDIGLVLDINLLLALCELVGVTPNYLLGYEDQTTDGWHKYPDTCPDEAQQVIIRGVVSKTIRYAEAVYCNGAFFQPEDAADGIYLYPLQMDTTHWTDAPSREIS